MFSNSFQVESFLGLQSIFFWSNDFLNKCLDKRFQGLQQQKKRINGCFSWQRMAFYLFKSCPVRFWGWGAVLWVVFDLRLSPAGAECDLNAVMEGEGQGLRVGVTGKGGFPVRRGRVVRSRVPEVTDANHPVLAISNDVRVRRGLEKDSADPEVIPRSNHAA